MKKFIVISPTGTPVMSTESIECVPDADTLQNMKLAGYKFKIDDKIVSPKQVHSLIEKYSE